MEDTWSVYRLDDKQQWLHSVFDGHGNADVACFCAVNLPRFLEEVLATETAPEKVFEEAFMRTHRAIGTDIALKGGTCVASVWQQGNVLHIGNLGDCRVVLRRKEGEVERLSCDHKACDEEERKEIEQRGGIVVGGRLSGILNVSRSLGDYRGEKYINRKPHVKSGVSVEQGDVLFVASDGLFDILSDEEVAECVDDLDNATADECAQYLKNMALANGSKDNITVMVLFF